jgi:choline dehydrogenase-like flavoprotein
LKECLSFPGFEYVPGAEVSHLRLGPDNHPRAVVARMLDSGEEREFSADRVALAAGALLSTRIFLTTMLRERGTRLRLRGLMDNRQVLVPFVNLGMIGREFSSETYQYHLLGMGLQSESPRDYVHGQITTLKTALTHPLIQRLPLGLAASTRAFRAVHAALGLINVNFRDTRRDSSYVELAAEDDSKIRIHYEPDSDEPARIKTALRRVKRALWTLNCIVPPGMAHVRPMGASVHYAGTLPMTREAGALTVDSNGQSRDVAGLYFVDGATFPFLPAKNITFTLMANATRIAEAAF